MNRLTLLALGLLLVFGPSLPAQQPKEDQKGSVLVPLMIKQLESQDAIARQRAASTLGRAGKGAQDAIPALENALKKETDSDVRDAIEKALDKINSDIKAESPEVKLMASFVRREGVKVRVDYRREGFPTSVTVTTPDFGDVDVDPMLLIKNLEHANLSGTAVGDDGLKKLEKKTMLRSLDLSKTRVTDKGMTALKDMTNLTYLNLSETAVTDQGLEALKGLTQLRELDLGKDMIRGPGLSALKGLKSLTSLNLTDSRVDDSGLEQLKNETSLIDLYLAGSNVDDAGLSNLAGLNHLEKLDLARTKITDAGLDRLKTLTNLREVRLSGTGVTTPGIQALQQALPPRAFIVFP